MSYTRPNNFASSTKLQAGFFTGNTDALRLYLHEGIVSGDIETTPWVDTRHVAGPPTIEPYANLQHGVGGIQGGPRQLGSLAQFTFATSAFTGASVAGWSPVPLTAIRLHVRRPIDVLIHWWAEALGGPDDRTNFGVAEADRTCYIAPYVSNASFRKDHQITRTHRNGFDNINNVSAPLRPYELLGGWSSMEGTTIAVRRSDNFIGELDVGLAAYTLLSKTVLLNWNVSVEAWY